ncbi:MAG: glycosyltransferase [Pirellulales bacterium]|nr:glycosyltransferase [Pirellulales bacterium]
MTARADVHVHSKYSDRPSEWLLRRIGAPESFVEPLELYQRARQRGMDYVTISDHNCIDGALEIAHLPGTFLSAEITTYFPENGCKIHCLVLGISEEQFATIQRIRGSIYDFQSYVIEQGIICSVAHPLFRVNGQLTVRQLEKLFLLFHRFEAINGTRDGRACALSNYVLGSLTPELIEEMSDWHGLAPCGAMPWRKTFTAGSDDHSGLYIASAYTTTPDAITVDEFLAHLRRGEHEPAGTSGTSLRLAHSFYHIAAAFYKARFLNQADEQHSFLGELFRKLLERPSRPTSIFLGDKLRGMAGWLIGASPQHELTEIEQLLLEEFHDLFAARDLAENRSSETPPAEADDRHVFQLASTISQQLSYAFLKKFVAGFQKGRLIESLQTLVSLGPVGLAVAPYLAAFHTQHKDERFLQAVAARFHLPPELCEKSPRKAWITDTLADVNGVARTIVALGRVAANTGCDLTVVTCLDRVPEEMQTPLLNFRPVGDFELPEYESQRLAIPPFLEVIERLERECFSELIISTPGPLGLMGLAAARLLGLKVTGIYHTDFPRMVRHFTQDAGLEQLTLRYMLWFFGQMDTLFVPSESYRELLTRQGFDPAKLVVLRRGVDCALFHPARREESFWHRYGLGPGPKLLYVGRLSKEKNLDRLCEEFALAQRRGMKASLILVGDGPQADELRARWQQHGVLFTGVLEGPTLATAYASADLFVFPSTTDTFGNAVLEAMACGLPAIVSDRGGPQETVGFYQAGVVADIYEPGRWAEVMARLVQDNHERDELSRRAVRTARESRWELVFDQLWNARAAAPLSPELLDAPVCSDAAELPAYEAFDLA